MLKDALKLFLPPIAIRVARRLFPARPAPSAASPPEYECLPEGFSPARSGVRGWNERSILETQRSKWPRFLESMSGTGPLGVAHEASAPSGEDYGAHNTLMAYAYVLALAARRKDALSILDWGGGLGHYYIISRALLPGLELDYCCKDLPLLCQGGRELLPSVTFFDDEESCFRRTYDLVLASASLHYSADWRSVVARLASAARSYLFITRLPVVNRSPSFAVLQRPYRYGYDTEYVGWFLNRTEFLDHLASLRMKLLREFLVQDRVRPHNAPEEGGYRGFLFKPIGEGQG